MLPPTFCLYLPENHGSSRHILVDANLANNRWALKPKPHHTGAWNINRKRAQNTNCKFDYTYIFEAHTTSDKIYRMISRTYTWVPGVGNIELVVTNGDSVYPVYTLYKHWEILGPPALLQNNMEILYELSVAPAPTLLQIQQGASLQPFVAKQLLELARSKHEVCPITLEEFRVGETAVMPCGHLFMKLAIEEICSASASAPACPSCRQAGTPTFV